MSFRGQVAHERQTMAFIDQNPCEVLVTSRKRVSDGAGGWTRERVTDVPAQKMRKVSGFRISDVQQRTTVDGKLVSPMFSLVAMPDARIKHGDIVIVDGKNYEIVFVSLDPSWRLSAEAIEASDV